MTAKAKAHKTYRLDADVVEAAEAWARDKGMGNGEAVEALLKIALEGGSREDDARAGAAEIADILKANMADLRAQVDTLKAQLEVKDEQIAAQAAQISGLMEITDHAQQLHAAAVAGYLAPTAQGTASRTEQDGEDGHDSLEGDEDGAKAAETPAEPQERPATLWERIKRALMGN